MTTAIAPWIWKSTRPLHGIWGCSACRIGATPCVRMESSPRGEGLGWQPRSLRVLDVLMVPRDLRGVVLACGLVGATVFGLGTVLAAGDPIGWAYVALAVVGYPFLQTRLVPTFLWLLVAAAGGLLAEAGNASGWIECAVGLALAAVAALPVLPPPTTPTSAGGSYAGCPA